MTTASLRRSYWEGSRMIRGYHSLIMEEYEKIRQEESDALQERKRWAEKNMPRVVDIEKRIAKLSLELAMLNFKQKDNREEHFDKLKSEIIELRGEKMEALVERGLSPDYLSMQHRCGKCLDTGYVGTAKCNCYKQKLVNLYYRNSDFNDMIRKYSFKDFRLDLYSNSSSEDPSPRKNIESILESMYDYMKNFEATEENLLFYGNPGVGKTFLSTCMAGELLNQGWFVVYRTSDSLIQNLKDIKFNDNDELMDVLMNCDLLIIDDLGTELTTEFAKVELFNFINTKLLRKKKMLISTNLTIDGLKSKYQERIFSRLMGDFSLYKFSGDDLRIKINTEKRRSLG